MNKKLANQAPLLLPSDGSCENDFLTLHSENKGAERNSTPLKAHKNLSIFI